MNINVQRWLGAFTYLEMILVISIIALSTVVIYPKVSEMSVLWTLDTEAYKMKAKIREIQQLAIAKQKAYQILFDPIGDNYTTYEYTGTYTVLENISLANSTNLVSTTFTLLAPNKMSFDNFGGVNEGGDVMLRDVKGKTKTVHITAVTGKVDVY